MTVPEERGSFLRFCATLDGHGITEFNYRIADGEQAHLFVGVQIGGREDAERIAGAPARRRLRRRSTSPTTSSPSSTCAT